MLLFSGFCSPVVDKSPPTPELGSVKIIFSSSPPPSPQTGPSLQAPAPDQRAMCGDQAGRAAANSCLLSRADLPDGSVLLFESLVTRTGCERQPVTSNYYALQKHHHFGPIS
jgi:hypothetical protein